jgi:phage terminase small subunit
VTGKPLTAKQAAFVREYPLDLDATAAAKRAGYKGGHVKVTAHDLLHLPRYAHVQAALGALLKRRADRVEVKADDVLRTLLRLLNSDIRQAFKEDGSLKPIHELPEDVALAIASIETDELFDGQGRDRTQVGVTRKVKFWNKERAVELAMKHLGLLTDRLEVSGSITYVVRDPFAQKAKEQEHEAAHA